MHKPFSFSLLMFALFIVTGASGNSPSLGRLVELPNRDASRMVLTREVEHYEHPDPGIDFARKQTLDSSLPSMGSRVVITQPSNENEIEIMSADTKRVFISGKEAERRTWERATPEFTWAFLEKSLRSEIIERLSHYRQEQGLTQSELAERTSTTQPMLSRFFSGADQRSPSLDTLVKLAWGLKKDVRIDFIERLSDLCSARHPQIASRIRDSLVNSVKPVTPNGQANLLAHHTQLSKIRLAKCDFQFPNQDEGDQPLTEATFVFEACSTKHKTEHMFSPPEGSANGRLRIQTFFSACVPSERKGQPFLAIKAMVEAHYSLDRTTPQDAIAHTPAFAESHAVSHALPFYSRAVDLLTAELS